MDGKQYDIAIVIACYNRLNYLRQTIFSLSKSNFPASTAIIIIDDGSNDDVKHFLETFPDYGTDHFIFTREKNIGNTTTRRESFELAYNAGVKYIICLDSDAIVKPNWLEKLFELHEIFPDNIISGFNANNPDHKELHSGINFRAKASIGGINFLITRHQYETILRSCMNENGWDWGLSRKVQQLNSFFIVTKPSVVQHIGLHEGMHATNQIDKADIAEDYD